MHCLLLSLLFLAGIPDNTQLFVLEWLFPLKILALLDLGQTALILCIVLARQPLLTIQTMSESLEKPIMSISYVPTALALTILRMLCRT